MEVCTVSGSCRLRAAFYISACSRQISRRSAAFLALLMGSVPRIFASFWFSLAIWSFMMTPPQKLSWKRPPGSPRRPCANFAIFSFCEVNPLVRSSLLYPHLSAGQLLLCIRHRLCPERPFQTGKSAYKRPYRPSNHPFP